MTLVERLRKGTRFHPTGSNAVVDARDVAHWMVSVMEHGISGERYLLVGENLSYQRLFALLSTALGQTVPSIPLPAWSLELAWRVERLRTLLTGSTPFITRDTAHSARSHRSYSSAKILALLPHRPYSAEEAIANVARFLAGTAHQ